MNTCLHTGHNAGTMRADTAARILAWIQQHNLPLCAHLPAQGLAGNSHMLMMDRNQDAVAALVQAWFVRHGLAR